jgi:hypothetical protein
MLARRADEGCDIHATTDFFRRMKLSETDYDDPRAKLALAVDGSRWRSTASTVILSGETEAAKEGRSTSDKDNFFGNNATSMTKAKITPNAISNRSTAAPIRRRAQILFIASTILRPSRPACSLRPISSALPVGLDVALVQHCLRSHATHSARTTGRRLSSIDHCGNSFGP